MKKLRLFSLLLLSLLLFSCASSTEQKPHKILTHKNIQQLDDIQIFSSKNPEGKITPKTIEKAFISVGLEVPGNNNMNRPFATRFKKLHHKVYNLAIYLNSDLTYRLLKKYPQFGVLTPLSMSIWEDKDAIINISTLSINGISRVTNIPVSDPDLLAYTALIKKALQTAMPEGNFIQLDHNIEYPCKSLGTNFEMKVTLDASQNMEEFIEDFEAEFESEMEPLGFLLPNFINVQKEIFDPKGYVGVYDFYHTYSLCKFDVIYPVSKDHPEAGAWAPCSFYLYKKSDEDIMHIGFLSVENWISTTGMKDDEEGTKKLREAQHYLEEIMKDVIDD